MLTRVRLSGESIRWLQARRVYFENDLQAPRLRPGEELTFHTGLQLEPYCAFLGGHGLAQLGSFSYSWSPLPPGMQVGRYCSIARGLVIPRPRHPLEYVSTSSFTYDARFSLFRQAAVDRAGAEHPRPLFANPQRPDPVIGHDVWIGLNVSLMPGVVVHDGAVIASHAVVTRDVPPYTVVGGNPARVIRPRFPPELADRLQALAWWRYHFVDLDGLALDAPERFATQLTQRQPSLQPFEPEPVRLDELPGRG